MRNALNREWVRALLGMSSFLIAMHKEKLPVAASVGEINLIILQIQYGKKEL